MLQGLLQVRTVMGMVSGHGYAMSGDILLPGWNKNAVYQWGGTCWFMWSVQSTTLLKCATNHFLLCKRKMFPAHIQLFTS